MDTFNFLKFWSAGGAPETNTFVSAITSSDIEDSDEENDGPYFDLEFTVSNEDEPKIDTGDGDGPVIRDLSISPISPELNSSKLNSKLPFPGSLLKSAIKCRILTFGLKKSKQNMSGKTEENRGMKIFTVKFKIDEVRFMSLFTKSSENKNSEEVNPDEKRLLKDIMQKYLKKAKLKFSGQQKEFPVKSPPQKKQGNFPAGSRVAGKNLQKSRSANFPAPVPARFVSSKRDDSVLQQRDGIQGAILHCKKSFHNVN